MSTLQNSSAFRRKALPLAIATQLLVATHAYAGPTGGNVVGGDGDIQQAGNHTRIDQHSDRLAIEWDTFNLRRNESVRFNQPSESSVALNRILDHNGSEILGRIDANGRVILMNPNGIFFGRNATVNVGSLVATGLMVDTQEFLNGDIVMEGLDGSSGTVINRGMIRAATGGNVALIGKRVENNGLISANLGHVALAAGEQAVVTFDEQGLLGVRIDEATLENEVGVINRGNIQAREGKILLSGSVSEDLFSRAVNSGDMGGGLGAEVHEDGSFTLGSGVGVVNNGNLNTAHNGSEAGEVFLVGETVVHRGAISAGEVHMRAYDAITLAQNGRISAHQADDSGTVTAVSDRYLAQANTQVEANGEVRLRTTGLTRLGPTNAENLSITTIADVRQSGPVQIRDTLDLNLGSEADVRLTNANNDFYRVNAHTESGSSLRLTDRNDLVLGDLVVRDSTFRVNAPHGQLRQEADSTIALSNSALYLNAHAIELGAGEAGTTAHDSLVNLRFQETLNTQGSLSAHGADGSSRFVARGEHGLSTADINSGNTGEAFDINVHLYEPLVGGIDIHTLSATNAAFTSIRYGDVRQTHAIEVTNNFRLHLGHGPTAFLNHKDNDFHRVHIVGEQNNEIHLYDKNSLVLGDIKLDSGMLQVTAADTISQAANTTLDNYGLVVLDADRILLGSRANSRTLNLVQLELNFASELATNNSIEQVPSNYETPISLARGQNGREQVAVTSEGEGAFDAHISIDAMNEITHFGRVQADTMSLVIAGDVTQGEPLALANKLHIDAVGEYSIVELNHKANRIANFSLHSAGGQFDLVTEGSLTLGDFDLAHTGVNISAQGDGAYLTQAENSQINTGHARIELSADHIALGEAGASVQLNPYSDLLFNFDNTLNTNNAITTSAAIDFGGGDVHYYSGVSAKSHDLHLVSWEGFDAHIRREGYDQTVIHQLDVDQASFSTAHEIVQLNPISVRDQLNLSLASYAKVELAHPGNQLGLIHADTTYNSTTSLAAASEVVLGDITVEDSNLHLTAHGVGSSIRQAPNSQMQLSNALASLSAAHIELGANESHVTAHDSHLELYFGQTLDTHQAIHAPGDYNFSSFLAEGTRSPNQVTLSAGNNFDAAIQLFEPETGGGIHIGRLQADSASFMTLSDITQSGAIALDLVDFYLPMMGTITLTHEDNQIHQLSADLDFGSEIHLHTTTDLSLHSLDLLDIKANLSANGTLSQQNNSHMEMRDAQVKLSADRVLLGESGSTTHLDSYNSLTLEFEQEVNTNHSISISSLPDSFNLVSAQSQGVNISGSEVFDVHIVKAPEETVVHSLAAEDAQFVSAQDISQTGPVDLTGTLELNLAAYTQAAFTDPGNRIHQLTAQSTYNSWVQVAAQDDVLLGSLTLEDSHIEVQALGQGSTIRQASGTHISLNGGLRLDADNIELGANNSSTSSYNGYLQLDFVESAHTHGSISAPGDWNFSWFSASGQNDINRVEVSSGGQFDLGVNLSDYDGPIDVHALTADNATFQSLGTISQVGAINVANNLHLQMQAGGTVNLNHSENTINELTMDLGYTTSVELTNNGDLALGSSTIGDSSVYITALGEEARIYQAFDSELYGADAYLSLTADHIELGADGTADLSFYGIGILHMDFNRALSLTGDITMSGMYAGIIGYGSDLGNEVLIGEQASFNLNASFTNYRLETGTGNDQVTILSDLPLPVYTIAGENTIEVGSTSIDFDVADYDPNKDTIVYLTP